MTSETMTKSSTKKRMINKGKLNKYGKPNENTPAEQLENYSHYSRSKSTGPTVTVKTENNGVDEIDKNWEMENDTTEIDIADVLIKSEEIFIKMEYPERLSPKDEKKENKRKKKRKENQCAESKGSTIMES
ncbi:PREDICTED: H/ACA ribonucleoprotein complex subunit 4-like, partial [Dinoponera quadriceps]|uniref:H/ACA ribonucleoprotein complex subunit 4-like n=1 Tax=Dinoponera quadriceps TaxID=609295 RepID=A0A6P3YA92_DINQU